MKILILCVQRMKSKTKKSNFGNQIEYFFKIIAPYSLTLHGIWFEVLLPYF